MNNGIFFALAAYASFAFADATIKSLGPGISVFEVGFFTTLSSTILIFFAKPKDERWRFFWKARMPLAVHARALCGLLAGIFTVYAFTTVPLAEVYALIFLAPLIVTVLSALILKETVGIWRWASVVAGICGVLLVVRPGFKALELGHLAALCIAVVAACSAILLRSMAGREKRTSIMGTLIIYCLIGNLLMGWKDFVVPSYTQLGTFFIIGTLTAIGQLMFLTASKLVPASQIAPTHYSQIAWAVILGAMFYGERPDTLAYLGLILIVAAGLITIFRERIRFGAVRAIPFFRSRN